MKKTILTAAFLLAATTAQAGEFSVEPGIGFVISEDSSAPAESIKARYQFATPFFVEGAFLHGHDVDSRQLGTLWEPYETTGTHKNINDIQSSFTPNGYFIGLGARMPLDDMLLVLSVGGAITDTKEKSQTTTTDVYVTVDPITKERTSETTVSTSYQKWNTDNFSPYMSLQLEQPINATSSFLIGGTVYKTELHDILNVAVSLNFKF